MPRHSHASSSLNVGDYVYHAGVNGNGKIVTIDNNKQRDKYGVQFFWHKYKDATLHNLDGFLREPMGRWCSEDALLPTPMPEQRNTVCLPPGRSLESLIRKICHFPKASRGDIAINYGNGIRANATLILNRNVTYNKLDQMRIMRGHGVSVPEVSTDRASVPTDGSWILKPHHSIGGKNIEVYTGQSANGRYYQKRINKVREFRVHTALWNIPKAWLIQEKKIYNRDQLCWNKKQGGSFHYVYEPMMPNAVSEARIDADLIVKLCSIAVDATVALKMDFGGVDIGLDADGNVYVFEVNARCGLRERTLASFKQVFWKLYALDIQHYMNNRWLVTDNIQNR